MLFRKRQAICYLLAEKDTKLSGGSIDHGYSPLIWIVTPGVLFHFKIVVTKAPCLVFGQ